MLPSKIKSLFKEKYTELEFIFSPSAKLIPVLKVKLAVFPSAEIV